MIPRDVLASLFSLFWHVDAKGGEVVSLGLGDLHGLGSSMCVYHFYGLCPMDVLLSLKHLLFGFMCSSVRLYYIVRLCVILSIMDVKTGYGSYYYGFIIWIILLWISEFLTSCMVEMKYVVWYDF